MLPELPQKLPSWAENAHLGAIMPHLGAIIACLGAIMSPSCPFCSLSCRQHVEKSTEKHNPRANIAQHRLRQPTRCSDTSSEPPKNLSFSKCFPLSCPCPKILEKLFQNCFISFQVELRMPILALLCPILALSWPLLGPSCRHLAPVGRPLVANMSNKLLKNTTLEPTSSKTVPKMPDTLPSSQMKTNQKTLRLFNVFRFTAHLLKSFKMLPEQPHKLPSWAQNAHLGAIMPHRGAILAPPGAYHSDFLWFSTPLDSNLCDF